MQSDSEAAPTPAKKRSPARKRASPKKKPSRATKKPRQLATYDSDSDEDEEDDVPKGWGDEKPTRKSGRGKR